MKFELHRQPAHKRSALGEPAAGFAIGNESTEDAAKQEETLFKLKAEGNELADSGCYHEALIKFKNAIVISPENATLHELCAQCLLALDRDLAACRSAQIAVSLTPEWSEAHRTLARALRNLGELDLAVESFAKVCKLDPSEDAFCEAKECEAIQRLIERERSQLLKRAEKADNPQTAEVLRCRANMRPRVYAPTSPHCATKRSTNIYDNDDR